MYLVLNNEMKQQGLFIKKERNDIIAQLQRLSGEVEGVTVKYDTVKFVKSPLKSTFTIESYSSKVSISVTLID
ncbi:hypothetical protein I4U23_028439 [Adineta vaga]|nr:hypothetical protein I4U23_028439 [Adineta vaga]